jgi:hypothetical protein
VGSADAAGLGLIGRGFGGQSGCADGAEPAAPDGRGPALGDSFGAVGTVCVAWGTLAGSGSLRVRYQTAPSVSASAANTPASNPDLICLPQAPCRDADTQ